MTYGYIRVSTTRQNMERQERAILAAYPEADCSYRDSTTGAKMNRSAWERLMKRVHSGDTIVFDSVSRMSRNAAEGWESYRALMDRGVALVFLNEPHINTATYQNALRSAVPLTGGAVDAILKGVNEYLLILAEQQVILAFQQAEKELEDLRKRTRGGMETARRAGKQIGAVPGKKLETKKSRAAKAVIRRHSKAFGGTLSDAECMRLCGVSRNTFYKYKRELAEE